MSITKSGIKSFSLYKDCPTPYDYLTCCCYQRYLLGLTTSYKALVKVFQRIVASNSLRPYTKDDERHYYLDERYSTAYIHLHSVWSPKICYYAFGVSFPISHSNHLYKEIRTDSAAYSRNFLKVIFLLLKTGMLIIMTFYCFVYLFYLMIQKCYTLMLSSAI